MGEALQFIGARIVQSLREKSWHDAWVRYELVDEGVGQGTYRYRETPEGVEKDFYLEGSIAVMRQIELMRDRIAANTAAADLPAGRLAEAFQVVVNE